MARRFGFAHDRQGYDQMFGAIFPHGEDPEVFSLTRDIEKLLGVPPGSWFGIIREEDHLEETPQLTRDEAKRLIAEVRRLVAAPNFLRDIAAIRSRVGTPEEALQQVYMTLYQLLRPTALAFRLRGDPGCLVRMQEAIAPHLKDSKLRSTIHEVETRLLQVESGSLLGPRDGTIAQDTVKLRIRHAISDAEVRLTVPAGSTMGDILQALAKAARAPQIACLRAQGGDACDSFPQSVGMKSIGKILVRPFSGAIERSVQDAEPKRSLSHAPSAPLLKGNGAQISQKLKPRSHAPREMPKWLEHELMQERYAEQAHEDWRRDVSHRLTQIRQKPRLNDALNVLVYQLKRDGLTEGELFERIDANKEPFEFRGEIKSQEDYLPENFGLPDDKDKNDSLDAYNPGDRVKLRLCISNKALQVDEHDEPHTLHGTIVGRGPRKETYLLKLEDNEEKLLVKPRHMSKTKASTSTSSKSRLPRNGTVDDPNVLKQGRLVEQRKGGAFTSFQDSEQLGKRRRLLLLGVELQDASRSGKPKLTRRIVGMSGIVGMFLQENREQAVQLQLELLSEFSSASFQRRLAELKNAHPNGPHFYVERRKLILSVQTKVIPKFGFAGDLGGVLEMVRVLGSFPDGDGEMGRRGWEIERLIGEREELEATSPRKDGRSRKDGLETDASEEVLDLQEAPPARSDAETVPTDAVDTFSDFVAALDELDHEMPDDAVSPKAGSMAFAPNNTAVEADAIEHSPIEADTLEVSDSKEVEEAPGKADASAVEDRSSVMRSDALKTPMEDDALEMEVARLVQETPAEAAAVETEVEKALTSATLVEETPAEADSGAAEAAEESAVEASAADEHEAAEQAAAETEAEEADAVDIEAADAVEMEAAEAVEEEGDFKDTDGEEEEDEDIDEDWDEHEGCTTAVGRCDPSCAALSIKENEQMLGSLRVPPGGFGRFCMLPTGDAFAWHRSSTFGYWKKVEPSSRDSFAQWLLVIGTTSCLGLLSASAQWQEHNVGLMVTAITISSACLLLSTSSVFFHSRLRREIRLQMEEGLWCAEDMMEVFFLIQVVAMNVTLMMLPLSQEDPLDRARYFTWESAYFKLIPLACSRFSRALDKFQKFWMIADESRGRLESARVRRELRFRM
eukprot:g15580.t1